MCGDGFRFYRAENLGLRVYGHSNAPFGVGGGGGGGGSGSCFWVCVREQLDLSMLCGELGLGFRDYRER